MTARDFGLRLTGLPAVAVLGNSPRVDCYKRQDLMKRRGFLTGLGSVPFAATLSASVGEGRCVEQRAFSF